MKATRSRYSSLTTTPTALFAFGFLLIAPLAAASILGSVRGLIHDPQHRPVRGAIVKLRAVGSAFAQTVNRNDAGEFVFDKIPIGEYTIERPPCTRRWESCRKQIQQQRRRGI